MSLGQLIPARRRTVTTKDADIDRNNPMQISDHTIPAMTEEMARDTFAVATPSLMTEGMTSTDIRVERTAFTGDMAAKKLPI